MRLPPRLAPALLMVALAAYVTAQTVATHGQWLVTISTTIPFVAQPVTVKAYYFDPASGTTYPVECNATLVNTTDVITSWRFNGTPAVLVFSLNSTGSYQLYVTCASGGVSYQTVYQLRVAWPAPRVTIQALYGRPVNVTVEAPYPYTGVWVHAVLCGDPWLAGWARMEDGVAALTLPPLKEPCTLTIEYLGGSVAVNVTPEPPRLVVKPRNATIGVAGSVSFAVTLVDRYGVVPVNATRLLSVSVAGPCNATVSGDGVVTVTGLSPGRCTATINATLWPGETLADTIYVDVAPPRVSLEPMVHCARLNCTVGVLVARGARWPAEASLYVDGELVASWRFNTTSFYSSVGVRLEPGDHNVTVVYRGFSPTGWVQIVANSTTITVPRLPARVSVETLVPEGGTPEVNATFYTVDVDGARYVVYDYPGNTLYEPVNGTARYYVLEPYLRVTERSVTVSGGAPGAVVEAWCLDHDGTWRRVLRETLNSSEASFELPRWCLAARAVYRYGWYTVYAYANQPPVTIHPIVCAAGEPCRLPAGGAIAAVYIAGRVYKPGVNVSLPPGVYTLAVRTVDGFLLTTWLEVTGRTVLVTAWSVDGRWHTSVSGGDVILVLGDGRVLELQPGVYELPAPPVKAWSPAGPVELIVYKKLVSVASIEAGYTGG